ncbi:MAG: transporter substrate-binding domain-containing protein [Desulfovibrionaceae bacterium]
MTRRMLLCLVLLLCAALPLSAASQELRVVTENWPPYNYLEDGVVTGCSTQVVRAVLEEAGLHADIELLPWARAYLVAQSLPNVLIYTIARTPEREEFFHWIGPMGHRRVHFFRQASGPEFVVNGPEDIRDHVLGLVRGDFSHQYCQSLGLEEGEHYILAGSVEQSLEMLLAGRVSLISGTDEVMAQLLRDRGLEPETVVPVFELPGESGYYMALSKGSDEDVLAALQEAFARLEALGEVQRLNTTCFRPWRIGPAPPAAP